MRFLELMVNELFYVGFSKEQFYQVKDQARERNRKTLIVWAVASGLFYIAAAFLYNVLNDALGVGILVVTLATSVVTLMCALVFSKRYPWLVTVAMYLFELSILGNGVALSVFHSPNRDCGTIVLAAIIPSAFTDRTISMIVLELITIIAYAIVGNCGLIAPDAFSWGLFSLCFYVVVGLLNGHFINKDRLERFVFADSAMKLAELRKSYNKELEREVEAKTERIVALNDQYIMGMATMVESRDNSTGGHIKRTSEGVRLLIEAIRQDGSLELSDSFCEKIVKAAPMHDLGKIAVDDAILRKPGRFTPEEYEEMKTHAAEGARVLREIMAGTDDEEYRRIAENVAHYHHERVDGSGYPDGLKGDEIPLEARIMAIADVYDALVSERVYKESYSFEKADQIIMDGMGTQFDLRLKKCYEDARPKLEAYYAQG